MLLVVDIGNTQTHLGVYQSKDLVMSWRLTSRDTYTADELLIQLYDLISGEIDPSDVTHAAIASVVPRLSAEWVIAARKLCGCEPLLLSHETAISLTYDYSFPGEIGADRIADCVAAAELYGAPIVVVDFGTATNIEIINKDGAFEGGIIAPGLLTSANALFSAAARLPRIEVETPPTVIGKSTKHAVQSGLSFGEIDRIDGLVLRIFDELGYTCPVIGTGGLSRRVLNLSKTITDVNDNLTLEGLRLIWEQST